MSKEAIFLQVLHNGRVELGLPPLPDLDARLAQAGPWLRLQDPTHTWRDGLLTRFGFASAVWAIAVPPPGAAPERRHWLAVGCRDGTIHVCDVRTGGVIEAGTPRRPLSWRGHEGSVRSVAWSADGRLASVSNDGTVCVWNPTGDGKPLWTGRGHEDWVWSVAWSANGRLATGSDDGTVCVWNPMGDGKPLWTGRGHEDWVWSVAWSADGHLASGSNDGTVCVWNPTGDGKPLWTGVEPEGLVQLVAWSADGRLASGSYDGTVCVWNPMGDSKPLWRSMDLGSQVASLGWSPDGRRLAVGTAMGRVLILDGLSGRVEFLFGSGAAVGALRWTRDGGELWAADTGGGTGRPRAYRLRLMGDPAGSPGRPDRAVRPGL